MSEHERVRRRLYRHFSRMLAECEQTVRDIRWWNRNRADCPPEDPEWFVVQAAGLRKCLAALERNEPLNPAWLQWA